MPSSGATGMWILIQPLYFTDAVIALQLAASGKYDPDMDVNGDGVVTSLDALMILRTAGAIKIC